MFRVHGGLSGHSNPSADETTRTECFHEHYATELEAIARARQLTTQLQPGGLVSVWEEGVGEGANVMFGDRFIGQVERHPAGPWDCSGQWWVNPEGINFRAMKGEDNGR